MLEKTDGATALAYNKLRTMRHMMTRQQVLSFKGQIKAGDAQGAIVGMERIRRRWKQ